MGIRLLRRGGEYSQRGLNELLCPAGGVVWVHAEEELVVWDSRGRGRNRRAGAVGVWDRETGEPDPARVGGLAGRVAGGDFGRGVARPHERGKAGWLLFDVGGAYGVCQSDIAHCDECCRVSFVILQLFVPGHA